MRKRWRNPWFRAALYAVLVLAILTAGYLVAVVRAGEFGPVTFERSRPRPDSVALPVLDGWQGRSRVQPRLGRVASESAARAIEVRCWSVSDWGQREEEVLAENGNPHGWTGIGGYLSQDGATIHLASTTCNKLVFLRELWESDTEESAFAVESLAHEIQHARGVESEAEADCYGYQSIAMLARKLGLHARQGHFLAVVAWETFYDPHDPAYGSAECREGGALDLHPERSDWP